MGRWFKGISIGEVMGRLDKDGEQEFAIYLPTGPKKITCSFPEGMCDKVDSLLSKKVTVKGKLHYDCTSPHPYLVEAESIEVKPAQKVSFQDLRGLWV